MIPDPQDGARRPGRRVCVRCPRGVLSRSLLLGPTTLEFWTKTAILASLVFACAGRFALGRLLAPLEEASGPVNAIRRLGMRAPAVLGVSLLLMTLLPLASELSLHGTIPAPRAPGRHAANAGARHRVQRRRRGHMDGHRRRSGAASPGGTVPAAASSRVWLLPSIPRVNLPANVIAFDGSINQAKADKWARDLVLDLMIESEARRAHDVTLARQGAIDDGLTEFTDVIKQDARRARASSRPTASTASSSPFSCRS